MTLNRCLALAALLAGFAFAGPKAEQPANLYSFEAEPSAALARYGQPSRDPNISLRASGAVYIAAVVGGHSGARFALSSSSDGGGSFAPPMTISPKGARVSCHGENSPPFLWGRGIETYALWEESTGEGIGTRLVASVSPAFGREWMPPVVVTDKDEPSTNAFSSLALAPNGHLFAAWLDGRDPDKGAPGTSAVYVARSTDGGKTWGENQAVAHNVCPCCRPTLAFTAGAAHVIWRHVYPGNLRDMAVASSRDGGQTWEAPVRIAKDGWKINGCPHAGAVTAVHDGRLWVSWYSDGDGSNPGVRLAYSDDGARTFSEPSLVSGEILDANHPDLSVADDGRLLLVFQGRDPDQSAGWSPAAPYLVEIDEDRRVSRPQRVPGTEKSIAYPRVAGGTLGRVFIAWTEKDAEGESQVRLSRGRRK